MANWYYYGANGEKIGPIRGRELKQFAQQGTITPETKVEDSEGRTAHAKNVTGLTFPEAPSPFTGPLPGTSIPVPPLHPSDSKIDFARHGTADCTKGVSEVIAHGKKSLISKPMLVAAAVLLVVIVGLAVFMGTEGTPALSPAEQAEVDKYIAEHGRDAIIHYLATVKKESDEKLVLKYVKNLVSKGADVNAKVDISTIIGSRRVEYTPLCFAAANGNVEVVKFLVSKGADVNATGPNGASPFGIARRNGHTAIVEYLSAMGAKEAQAQTGINLLIGYVEQYRADNREYPTTEQGLFALIYIPDTTEFSPTQVLPSGGIPGTMSGGAIDPMTGRDIGLDPMAGGSQGMGGRGTGQPQMYLHNPQLYAQLRKRSTPYVGSEKDLLDPWGKPYRYDNSRAYYGFNRTGSAVPAIWSVGPDGIDGTPDDVLGWDLAEANAALQQQQVKLQQSGRGMNPTGVDPYNMNNQMPFDPNNPMNPMGTQQPFGQPGQPMPMGPMPRGPGGDR